MDGPFFGCPINDEAQSRSPPRLPSRLLQRCSLRNLICRQWCHCNRSLVVVTTTLDLMTLNVPGHKWVQLCQPSFGPTAEKVTLIRILVTNYKLWENIMVIHSGCFWLIMVHIGWLKIWTILNDSKPSSTIISYSYSQTPWFAQTLTLWILCCRTWFKRLQKIPGIRNFLIQD